VSVGTSLGLGDLGLLNRDAGRGQRQVGIRRSVRVRETGGARPADESCSRETGLAITIANLGEKTACANDGACSRRSSGVLPSKSCSGIRGHMISGVFQAGCEAFHGSDRHRLSR
jgi:hypothetical protein